MSGLNLANKKKIGFVCSGGAVKASAFHVGVAMALEQKGFRFRGSLREESDDSWSNYSSQKNIDVYVGSSAGALVATYLAQGNQTKDLVANFRNTETDSAIPGLKYWQMIHPRSRGIKEFFNPSEIWNKINSGIKGQSPFSTEGIANYLRSHVIRSDKFSNLTSDLFIVTTELDRSKKVVFGKYKSAPQEPYLEYRNDVSVSDACAASMALPPIYHPYPIQIEGHTRHFFDGEIREPLSSHVALDSGCDLIICSYTHQPLILHGHGKKSLAESSLEQITLQALYQSIEQKIWVARGIRTKEKALIDQVKSFFKKNNLNEKLLDQLVNELESRMIYKPEVDYIYIHPRSSDEEMFMASHFSLDKAKTERIVRKGYLAANSALKGLI